MIVRFEVQLGIGLDLQVNEVTAGMWLRFSQYF